jgi:alpha-galactosidase|eukprot:COSAG06_NODE_9474_length_1890_cov_5.730877_2_plen_258_part_00
MAQADAMVSSGMRDAGYVYINIDDLWAAKHRSANGSLVPDPAKFPSGFHALSAYIHGKGLKFGLYSDVGATTCGGQPGSFEHECADAQQFADWGVDWLKEDHCDLPTSSKGDIDGFYNSALGKMRDCLNATGRAIFFDVCAHSCYDSLERKHSPECWREWYENATALGNSWRTTTDINDSWKSVLNNWYRNDRFHETLALAQFNGPHHWNDPDSLVVGMGGLTPAQERLHFSMWALMAAPLIAGNRLDRMENRTIGE